MTAKIIQFRKPRQRTFAEQRAAEIDALVRRHFAEAFRHDRDAGALCVTLDADRTLQQMLPFHLDSQERIYL